MTEQSRDSVTGLPNAAALRERLDAASRHLRPSRLLMFRVDDYRATVAATGQESGDALLGEVGSRLTQMVRTADFVSHTETDTFAVLVEDSERLESAPVVERLSRAFEAPFTSGGRRQFLTLSTGSPSATALRSRFCATPSWRSRAPRHRVEADWRCSVRR